MTRQSLPSALIDQPSFLANNFGGYQNFIDKTVQPFNTLTAPSKNCTVPSFDKVIPDKGKTLYGQIFNENVGMVGNKQKFKNQGGIEMEVRVFKSGDANLKDVIQAGFQHSHIVFSTLVGVFTLGETISGQTSGATAIVDSVTGTVMALSSIVGIFVVGETILGQTSLATAVTVVVPAIHFHQITQNVNPLPRGAHEYYFDSWFDTKLANSIANSVPSKNTPRLVWVNGFEDPNLTGPNVPNTRKGAVYSWTGGIATITSFVANTSISINPATTWRSLGFTEDASGAVNVVINGVVHNVPVPADINTSTINVANTAGIAIGDTATSKIEVDIAPIPFDVCRQVKGYMYYGNWKYQQLYQSNAFNREFNYSVTNFQALANDLIVIPSMASPYTGTIEAVFHVVIDSIKPDINTQIFVGTGNNDARFLGTGNVQLPAGYTGTPGVENHYKVAIIANYTIVIPTPVPQFQLGEFIVSNNANPGVARLVYILPNGGNSELALEIFSGMFAAGDIITGQDSAATATIPVGGFKTFWQNWVQYFVNGILTPFTSSALTGNTLPIFTGLTITLTDGLIMVFGNYTGHNIGDYYELDIRQGGVDTFSWQKNGGVITPAVAITGALQPLSDGVQIKFQNKNGHQIGDFWDITATPTVARAWDSFYYALPVRRPGEGYIYQLPSNFWTMDTQEDSMYVNTSYGEWSLVATQLSGDLLSETVSLTPLKQTGANKVLYPYLTGHINDDLIYINTEKSLDTLGRREFLEKPQTGYLSDPVKLDFLASTFVGGRIKYFGKKLYISSPENGVTHCFDTFKKYWQPLKTFPEVGLLTIIGNELACHSGVRNQTFTMFTNTDGDNGQGYEVVIRTPYTSLGNRWNSKFSNQSFIEGYMTGNPKLLLTVYNGVSGCGGIFPHFIDVVTCTAPDRSPFGEGEFGGHSFGSDLDVPNSYFNEISKKFAPVMQYYFVALELSCIAKSHTWQLLSMGLNAMWSESGNNTLVAPNTLVVNNP